MKIATFKVEQWMNEWETKCKYNLAETCIDSLALRELLSLAGEDETKFMEELAESRFTYGHIWGSPELVKGIASLYETELEPMDIVVTHGAIGANYQTIMTLIEAKDNMISVMPTYQQHYSIPESIGAEVRILELNYENEFLPDLEKLKSLADENTKMITINNPNNPSGSLIPLETMKKIVEIAKSVGAYVLCDEVYRGISEDGSYMPSIIDLYEKGISVGSMSKTFSLAGLRLGWIASKDREFTDLCRERRDYDTISCPVIEDKLAALALKHKDAILARNREIVLKNRAILDEWVNETPEVYYRKPVAGNTALVYYKKDMSSRELCIKLLEETGVMFTPGECFEVEHSVRIGYAFDARMLKTGLDKFAEFLRNLEC